jgi:hypothetical protein
LRKPRALDVALDVALDITFDILEAKKLKA